MITVFGEGRGFRVVWLLEEMGLAYRLRPVDMLAGVEKGDGEEQARAAARKIAGLRLFEDAAGKMNLSAAEVEVDAIVGDGAGVGLRESPQLEDLRRFLSHQAILGG